MKNPYGNWQTKKEWAHAAYRQIDKAMEKQREKMYGPIVCKTTAVIDPAGEAKNVVCEVYGGRVTKV